MWSDLGPSRMYGTPNAQSLISMVILTWAEVEQNSKQKCTEVWWILFRNIIAKV
jgi:hypothetical protein